MEQLRRQFQLPKQKPAGVLSARRGLCSESGTAEQPTADKNYFVFLPCRGFVSKDLATAENGRLFFVRRTAQISKKSLQIGRIDFTNFANQVGELFLDSSLHFFPKFVVAHLELRRF